MSTKSECIFCKIVAGEIPAKKVYESHKVLGFYDVNPLAPVHVLLIPKIHIDSAACIDGENSHVIAEIFEAAAKLAKELGLEKGFRIVTNCAEHGCQSVGHFHLLGGKQLNPEMC